MAEAGGQQEFDGALEDLRLPRVPGGEQLSLGACLAGRRGVVVVFWSGVCSHCARYDGYLNGFEERHPELALLGVASRQGEDAVRIEEAIASRGLRFRIVHDADREAACRWLVRQTPRVFLLDAERRLVYRGAIDNFTYPQDPDHQPYLEDEVAAFLSGRPSPRRETASYGCPIQSVYYELPQPLTFGRREGSGA